MYRSTLSDLHFPLLPLMVNRQVCLTLGDSYRFGAEDIGVKP